METHHLGVTDVSDLLQQGHREAVIGVYHPRHASVCITHACWCQYSMLINVHSNVSYASVMGPLQSIPFALQQAHATTGAIKMTTVYNIIGMRDEHVRARMEQSAPMKDPHVPLTSNHATLDTRQTVELLLQQHTFRNDTPVMIERADGHDMDLPQLRAVLQALIRRQERQQQQQHASAAAVSDATVHMPAMESPPCPEMHQQYS